MGSDIWQGVIIAGGRQVYVPVMDEREGGKKGDLEANYGVVSDRYSWQGNNYLLSVELVWETHERLSYGDDYLNYQYV